MKAEKMIAVVFVSPEYDKLCRDSRGRVECYHEDRAPEAGKAALDWTRNARSDPPKSHYEARPVMVVPLAQWEAMERVIDEARNMTAAQDSECHLAAGAYASLMRLLVHALDATGAAAGKGE